MTVSDDIALMVRPFEGYAALAEAGDDRPGRTAAARAALLLFVIGAFVSLISAGRLVAFHVASTMVFWSFVPMFQAASFIGALRIVAPEEAQRPGRALALYFAGHGPWLLLLPALAGGCLFAPDVYTAATWMLTRGVLPALIGGAWIWSGVLTFACFRAGIGLSRRSAGKATALFYLGYVGVVIAYYLAMNQIQPQLPWAP